MRQERMQNHTKQKRNMRCRKPPGESKPKTIGGRFGTERAHLWVNWIRFGLKGAAIIPIKGGAAKATDLGGGDSLVVPLFPATADKATVAGYASRVAAHR